jgi:hypothetical protein
MKIFQMTNHFVAVFGVEISRQLIGEEEFWPQNDRSCDSHPLLFSTRQLGRSVVQTLRQTHEFKQFPGMARGLLTAWWDPIGLPMAAAGAFLGFGVFYFFAWAYWRLTGRHGLGGGDIKLLGMLGAFLGPQGVFTTILLSSVLGSLFGVAWALGTRKGDLMKSSLPFGPFLVVGGLYYYLLGDILWLPFTIPT